MSTSDTYSEVESLDITYLFVCLTLSGGPFPPYTINTSWTPGIPEENRSYLVSEYDVDYSVRFLDFKT